MMSLLNLLRALSKQKSWQRSFNIKKAYLKSKKPFMWGGKIYHNKNLVTGNGVCATMLLQKNIKRISI